MTCAILNKNKLLCLYYNFNGQSYFASFYWKYEKAYLCENTWTIFNLIMLKQKF